MQFQEVEINAPITVVHVSNEGNNNATNVNIGDGNSIVSEQKDLQSNRSDGDEPPESVASPAPEPPTQAAAWWADAATSEDGTGPLRT